MLQKISIANKCRSFELSINRRILKNNYSTLIIQEPSIIIVFDQRVFLWIMWHWKLE